LIDKSWRNFSSPELEAGGLKNKLRDFFKFDVEEWCEELTWEFESIKELLISLGVPPREVEARIKSVMRELSSGQRNSGINNTAKVAK